MLHITESMYFYNNVYIRIYKDAFKMLLTIGPSNSFMILLISDCTTLSLRNTLSLGTTNVTTRMLY